jgi:uncharacterized cupredoxin-like copper-binding protein
VKFAATIAAALCVAAVTTTMALGSGGTQSVALPTIDVAMSGKTMSVTGTLQSGAVTVRSNVTTDKGASPVFIHLNQGITAQQVFSLMGSKKGQDPNNLTPLGSIVFDIDVAKGTTDVQAVLPAGNYVGLDASHNKPITTTFTVEPNTSPAVLPAATQTQSAVDFGFHGPTVLKNGTTIRATNEGWVVHMIDAFGVKTPAVGRTVMQLLKAGKDNQAEKLANHREVAFAGPLSHGAVQQLVLHAKPGWYVEACFMDTQDGREHTQLGMERLIRIR